VLPELVKTRYGFHIVAIDRTIPGGRLPFAAVRDQIAQMLKASMEESALRQYISILAAQAEIIGVELDAACSPLVQ